MKMAIRFGKIKFIIQAIFITIFVSSCDLFEYQPYDTPNKEGLSDINNLNIAKISKNDNENDTIRFVFTGDTQRCYDETADFVKDVNKHSNIDFVIHGGDITDFGMSKEYIWMNDILHDLKVPYVVLIGNHDVVGQGKDIYKAYFGALNFDFTFRKTRFICLNTNALEFDYATPVPDFDFMTSFLKDTAGVKQTIVVMHSPPLDDQFNNNVGLMFNYIIERYKGLLFCLNAHRHILSEIDYYNNGIIYYGCDDIAGRNYLLFTVIGNKYSYQVVKF